VAPVANQGDTAFGEAFNPPANNINLDNIVACSEDFPLTAADGSVWQQVTGTSTYNGELEIIFAAAWGSDPNGVLLLVLPSLKCHPNPATYLGRQLDFVHIY
jgi:hypothetical protein